LAKQILKPSLLNHLDDSLHVLNNSLEFERNFLHFTDANLGYEFSLEIKRLKLPKDEVEKILKIF
jgi:hypothetical protein